MVRKRIAKNDQSGLLFKSLAEQVKLPFVQIAHAAELSRSQPDSAALQQLFDTISLTSDAALQLIDGYLLSVRLQAEPQLLLEPVPLSSVVYDTAQRLNSYAKAHDCELEVQLSGRYGPVMARREAVELALTSLGYSFIEAAAQQGTKTRITLAVRRNSRGINTGIFSGNQALSSSLFKQAKVLKGIVKQPLGDFSAGSGAGVFVADALFNYLDSPMQVARFQSLRGLAATLIPSRQLSLV